MNFIKFIKKRVLESPFAYSLLQSVMGASRVRTDLINKYIKPYPGMNVLDIGCGPADILNNLTDINYWGFDISKDYIDHAKIKFGFRAKFLCKKLEQSDLNDLPKFDVVLALGLIHHLNDDTAVQLLKLAKNSLNPSGKIITIDPCYDNDQNLIAKFLIMNDRGNHVRNMREYLALAKIVFKKPKVALKHQKFIPYTHCIMQLSDIIT